jgi:hypothetical protein
MRSLATQEGRMPIVAFVKDTQLTKEERHAEFRGLVYKYELTSKWIGGITGRDEATVRDWRMEAPTRVIPKRQFEKIKEALGLPVED